MKPEPVLGISARAPRRSRVSCRLHQPPSECLKGRDAEAAEIRKEGLSHRTAAGEPGLQQTKMKACNEEAGQKNLHGDERHAFMSACLKGQ